MKCKKSLSARATRWGPPKLVYLPDDDRETWPAVKQEAKTVGELVSFLHGFNAELHVCCVDDVLIVADDDGNEIATILLTGEGGTATAKKT